MLNHDYSYEDILNTSVKAAWTVDDCFQGRDFDFSRRFLPERIAGVDDISCLDHDEKRMLNQIRGNSYCHLFAFLEEYIVPLVIDRARADVYGDETRLWSLLRFAEEETKHQQMLRRANEQFAARFGVACGLVAGREAVAQAVLATSPLTALLLTSMAEWLTQLHYVEHVRDRGELDELFRDILRFHWIDESRHARLDSLLIDEIAGDSQRPGARGGDRRAPRARRRHRRAPLQTARAGHRRPGAGERRALHRRREDGDRVASAARLSLDVPRLRPSAPKLRPHRRPADHRRPEQDRRCHAGTRRLTGTKP